MNVEDGRGNCNCEKGALVVAWDSHSNRQS